MSYSKHGGFTHTSRQELQYWPYTIHQIDDTLDSSLIEGRAKQILFQALNSRTLTAFVGSGVSMAYGRMSWTEWQSRQIETVNNVALTFLDVTDASLNLMDGIERLLNPRSEKKIYWSSKSISDSALNSRENGDTSKARAHTIWRWLRYRKQVVKQARWEVYHMFNTFEAAVGEQGNFPGGESLPVKFEIAKKLHDLLLRHRVLFLWPEKDIDHHELAYGSKLDEEEGAPLREIRYIFNEMDEKPLLKANWKQGLLLNDGRCLQRIYEEKFNEYVSFAKQPEAMVSFEIFAKMLLVDECAHAESLLKIGLDRGVGSGRDDADKHEEGINLVKELNIISNRNLRRDISGIRQDKERFRILSAFTLDGIQSLVDGMRASDIDAFKGAPKCWKGFLDDLEQRWRLYDVDAAKHGSLSVRREFATPTSRFLLPVLLQLLLSPKEGFDECLSLNPPDLETFKSRRSIMADRFDPLRKVIRDLKVNRFLTTNYDFEIERQFQDIGFKRFGAGLASQIKVGSRGAENSSSYRTNGMGAVLCDMTFRAETAVDLINFTAGSDGADAGVFHLHGRAVASESIVVTERDYMNLYLRDDPKRESINESIQVAFASTTIFFIGLSMGEPDLLRPLRQFISNNDRNTGYKAVVLLAGRKSYKARAKEAAGLYMRYGVHTIYYGGGNVSYRQRGELERTLTRPLDWLYRVISLINVLQTSVEVRCKELDDIDFKYEIDKSKVDPILLKPLVDRKELLESVGLLGKDLKLKENEPDVYALPYLFGIELDEYLNCLESPLIVRDCFFTTRRHGGGNQETGDRKIVIDGKDYTGFYTSLLTKILQIALCQQSMSDIGQCRRHLRALSTALQGIDNAIMTACLNATLDSIHKEWRGWWHDWQQPPPYREARLEFIPPPPENYGFVDKHRDEIILPRRLVRHRVISVITNLMRCVHTTAPAVAPDPSTMKAFGAEYVTGIRVFDTFIYDVAATTSKLNSGHVGRLVHSVAASRGRGKGVFFSTFSTRLGITSYLRAAYPDSGKGDSDEAKPFILTAIFVNFSFAAEIASVYEMVEGELTRTLAIMQAFVSCTREEAAKYINQVSERHVLEMCIGSRSLSADSKLREFYRLIDDRIEAIVVEIHNELRTLQRTERCQILLNRFSVLSDEFPFNNCFHLKIKPRILICLNAVELLFDNKKLPKNREISAYLTFLLSNGSKKIPFDLVVVSDYSRMGLAWQSDSVLKRVVVEHQGVSLKIKSAIRKSASTMGIKIYPDNAIPVAMESNYVHIARPIEPREFMVDNFLLLALALFVRRRYWESEPNSQVLNSFDEKVREASSISIELYGRAWHGQETPDVNSLCWGVKSEFDKNLAKAVYATSLLPNQDGSVGTLREYLSKAFLGYKRASVYDYEGDDQDWHNLRNLLKGNRFCLTLLMAATQHLVLTKNTLLLGGIAANNLLKDVVTSIRNTSASLVETTVLEAVMGVYRDTTKIGDPDHDHELHLLLLRNIGVLGCPISPNVLVRLHDMRDYFNQVRMDDLVSRRRMVARALSVLSERGLVFRLSPHPKLQRLERKIHELEERWGDEFEKNIISSSYVDLNSAKSTFADWEASKEFRYGLHRQMQAYCLQRLGHLTVNPVNTNTFAPTLYSSMPSQVVRLSSEGYQFLRRMLLGLSQYPDIRQEDIARDRPIFSDDNVITQVQALRAAMSLVRSSFSVAAVSRYTDESTGLQFARKRGFLETYRVRLRWIIRKAWEIHEPRTSIDSSGFRVNALYRDEVVWLYNEVAVTCLAQGHLADGIAHARQALFLNQEIEGDGQNSYMHNMLSLNHSLLQLERGRLTGARSRLKRIRKNEKDQKKLVYWLATGYLGVIAHLRGRRNSGLRLLNSSIKWLRKGEEDRSLSIMLNHLAHLLADENPEKAVQVLREARHFAEAGGHEDIRNRVMLSEVQLFQFKLKMNWKTLRRDRKTLNEVENYSRVMGLDSLFVDTLHTQGRMLLASGDHNSSGKLVTRAISVARRNQMHLRLNSIMTTYGRVLEARGDESSANRMFEASLHMAKRLEFSNEVLKIHETIKKLGGSAVLDTES